MQLVNCVEQTQYTALTNVAEKYKPENTKAKVEINKTRAAMPTAADAMKLQQK